MSNANSQAISNPERLAALRRLCLLDSPVDPAFDRLTQLATRILKAPIALVSLIDDRRQFFKSQVGLDEPWASQREMSLDYSYCKHVVRTASPLIITDSRTHPLVADNPATLELGIVAYAGVPLITSDGDVLGTFCVIDKVARVWTEDEIATLVDLSKVVMTEIELHGELLERHRIEDALRSSEQRLQAVITSAPVIVFAVDRNGVFVMIEGRGLSNIMLKPEYMIGQSVFGFSGAKPENQQAVRRALNGEDVTFQVERETPRGWLRYETRMSPLHNAQGEIVGAIGVANDVSKRAEVEQAHEASIEQLKLLRRIQVELSESLDLDSVLTIAMDTALRASGAEHGFIGLIEGEQLRIVHAAGNYHAGDTWQSVSGVVGRALRSHQPQLVLDIDADPDFIRDIPDARAQMVIPLIHRDHLIGALNLKTTSPRLFTQEAFEFLGTVASHITVAIDNAQLYQVSQQQLIELHHLYMRVSELEQLKTDMIRIAAHDLRNPLGVVKTSAELLLEDPDIPADYREFLESIANAGRKMLKIITDILSLQRVEAMQQKSGQCDDIDLGDLARDVFNGNEARAQEKALAYQFVPAPTDALVCGDIAQLREAMDNLIGNAIKYTPEGGTVIVRLAHNNKSVVFEVEDSGSGVPEHQQRRLFQPFFRADNARASQVEGTGLGLHLVKNIIERHGGTMHFHSVLGEGSRFGFDLPRS